MNGNFVWSRETSTLIGSDKVEGTPVYRSNGDSVGQIERVMIENTQWQTIANGWSTLATTMDSDGRSGVYTWIAGSSCRR